VFTKNFNDLIFDEKSGKGIITSKISRAKTESIHRFVAVANRTIMMMMHCTASSAKTGSNVNKT